MSGLAKKHARKILLLTTLISLAGVAWIIFTLPPATSYDLGMLSLSILLAFFPLLFIFIFGLITLIFKRPVFGILVGILFIVLMIFRLNGLTHPFFILLILGIFISSLLFFKKDKVLERKK